MTLLAIGFAFVLGVMIGAAFMGLTIMHEIKSKGARQ
jgi:hypothetical protein